MKYVIIGGDAAGMSAAMQIVRRDEEAEITALEAGGIFSYSQCGLPYYISNMIEDREELMARSAETFREKYGVNAKSYHRVTGVDTENQTVSGVATETDEPFHYDYDRLLIATGATPKMPQWEGINLNNVHVLKTIPDADAIKLALEPSIRRVAIIGGGYIGLEAAEAFKKIGKDVMLIERGDQVGKIFDKDMSDHIHKEARRQGIQFIFNETVSALKGDTSVEAVQCEVEAYPADLVLISAGITPSTQFLTNPSFIKAENGALIVNELQETSVKNVYAAGDCTMHYHLIKKKPDYVPLGTTANKAGRIAGQNMSGENRAFKGIVGTSIMKFMDLHLGRSGLSEKECELEMIPYETVSIKSTDAAGYYPDAGELYVKLTYHAETKALLGGQIMGTAGVDKRVDVIATALFNEMTIHDLEDLDLSYAPPFNSVWDPLQQAARRVK